MVALGIGGWVTYRAAEAYQALSTAKAELSQAQLGSLSGLDATELQSYRDTLAQVQQHSATAVDAVEDPLYRLASTLPWVGDDLTAVSTVAHSIADAGSGSDNKGPRLWISSTVACGSCDSVRALKSAWTTLPGIRTGRMRRPRAPRT